MKILKPYYAWENRRNDYSLFETNKKIKTITQIDADIIGKSIYDILLAHISPYDKETRIDSLIKKGANVNYAHGMTKDTILMKACANSYNNIVRMLIGAGADVNKKDWAGFTALSSSQEISTVDILLKAGADINAKNNFGRTILFNTIELDFIIFLIENGAEMKIIDDNGENFIDVLYKIDDDLFNDLKLQTLILSKEPSMIKSFIRNNIPIHPNIPDELKHIVTGGDLNLL